jgi:E3 ubiquitin-protein ligase CBL
VYIFPDGQEGNPDIRKAIRVPPEDHVKVTQEQHDLYEQMDSTFELCKICSVRPKDVRIEPCGHLLCRGCLDNWIHESKGHVTLCPYCREKVLSTEGVIVDPFDSRGPRRPQKKLDPAAAAARASIFSVGDDEDEDYESSDDDEVSADYENINLSSFMARGGGVGVSSRSSPAVNRAPRLPPRGNSRKNSSAPPLRPRLGSSSAPDREIDDGAVAKLRDLGFAEPAVRKALKVAKGDIKMAADILLQFAE